MVKCLEINKKILLKVCLTYILIGCGFFLLYFWFHKEIFVFEHLVNSFALINLFLCNFLQLFIITLATYLRAHKKEPLVLVSILQAIFIVVSTYYIVNNYSNEFLFVGYFFSNIFMLSAVAYITYVQNKVDRSLK